jgi:hypothetical protein
MMAVNPKEFQATAAADDMLHLSLPEANALCVRAARGAGWSWGMAEECGEAACWLAQHHLDWAEIVLSCLQTPASRTIQPTAGVWTTKDALCGLHAGVTLAEFADLPEGLTDTGLCIAQVQDARLLLPFAARCAATKNHTLALHVDGTLWASVSKDGLALWDQTQDTTCVRIEISLTDALVSTTTPVRATAPLTPTQKAQLDGLALHMTVPSSAQSEARAGGELPDTD